MNTAHQECYIIEGRDAEQDTTMTICGIKYHSRQAKWEKIRAKQCKR